MRGRRAWIVGLIAALAIALAAAVPLGRSRIRTALEARCARTTEAVCRVGAIALAGDGFVARDVAIRESSTGLSVDVRLVAVGFSWWRLAWGSPQGMRVAIDGVRIRGDLSIERVLSEIEAIRARRERASRAGTRGARVEVVRVDAVDVDVARGQPVTAGLSEGSIEWIRGGALRFEWADARIGVGEGAAAHSGSCHASREANAYALTCDGSRGEIDVHEANAVATALDPIVRAARSVVRSTATVSRADGDPQRTGAAVGADGREPGVGSSGRSESDANESSVQVAVRRGSMRISRRGTLIADLSPAEFTLAAVGDEIESATVRLGRNGAGTNDSAAGAPSAASGAPLGVEVAFERIHGRPWHVDVNGSDLPLAEIARWVPVVPWHAIERGRVRMQFRAEPASDGSGAFVVDGRLAAESFGLFHPALAHDPIDDLDVAVEGEARIDPRRRRIETEGVRASVNGVVVALAGWAERPGAHEIALDASVRVPVTDCDAMRRSLPAVVTGALHDVVFSGTIGADAHLALDTRALAGTELQVDVDDRCQVVRDNMPLGIRRVRGVFVQRVTEPAGVRAFVTGPGSAAWVPLPQISPYMTRALLVREDGAFFRHHGFNTNEIRAAIVRNVAARRFVYGASTISMQLAKNIFLQREKTLVRKLQEVVLTWYLERSLDKDSILELYLNVVEFGPGIYGIGPASRFFFAREAAALSPMQAAYLATLLPNPVARFANFQRGAVSSGMTGALRAVVRRMAGAGYLTPDEARFAEGETLVFRPESVPVNGALTQNVDVATTDEMAAQLSPPPTEATVAPGGEDTSDGAPTAVDEVVSPTTE